MGIPIDDHDADRSIVKNFPRSRNPRDVCRRRVLREREDNVS